VSILADDEHGENERDPDQRAHPPVLRVVRVVPFRQSIERVVALRGRDEFDIVEKLRQEAFVVVPHVEGRGHHHQTGERLSDEKRRRGLGWIERDDRTHDRNPSHEQKRHEKRSVDVPPSPVDEPTHPQRCRVVLHRFVRPVSTQWLWFWGRNRPPAPEELTVRNGMPET
jgi:hypothetical protein